MRVRGVLLIIGARRRAARAGWAVVKLVALPFGGVGTSAVWLGMLVVIVALVVLALVGRRRQAARAGARAASAGG